MGKAWQNWVNSWYAWENFVNRKGSVKLFNRTGVAGAVLQTPSLLIHSFTDGLWNCLYDQVAEVEHMSSLLL